MKLAALADVMRVGRPGLSAFWLASLDRLVCNAYGVVPREARTNCVLPSSLVELRCVLWFIRFLNSTGAHEIKQY